MALRLEEIATAERDRIQPHVARLKVLVQRFDPEAGFVLRVGHDQDIWELDAYVRPDLADDPEFGHELAGEEVEILLDYDVLISVIPLPRRD
jgi:hypothetical protein